MLVCGMMTEPVRMLGALSQGMARRAEQHRDLRYQREGSGVAVALNGSRYVS